LFEYGSLFCGHDSGTFIVKNTSKKYISNQELGNLKRFLIKTLLQGSGISVLEKLNQSVAL
jgi:hypothetical protein